MKRTAKLSECGLYRYSLSRVWDPSKGVALFCMLNPSTADASADDPTIRKCIGFSERWGFGGIWVVNLFAFRATDPKELRAAQRRGVDIVGGDRNNEAILEAARSAGRIVVAWGAHALTWRPYAQNVALAIAAVSDKRPIWCLGLTKHRLPLHPLMLPYSTPLVNLADVK